MSFSPTIIKRAIDIQPLYVGIVAALTANTTINAALTVTDPATSDTFVKIFRDFDSTRMAFPFIAISTASAVPDHTYGSTGYDARMDIQVFTNADSTTADSLAYLAQQALLDTTWTITNYQIAHKTWANTFAGSQEFNGEQLYRVGFTMEIRAYRTS